MDEGDVGKIGSLERGNDNMIYIQFDERLQYSSCGQEFGLASVTIQTARRVPGRKVVIPSYSRYKARQQGETGCREH